MSLVRNERTKLTAAWLNMLATALITAGTFAPLAALWYGLSNSTVGRHYVALSAAISALLGFAFHWGGWAYLRRLRE